MSAPLKRKFWNVTFSWTKAIPFEEETKQAALYRAHGEFVNWFKGESAEISLSRFSQKAEESEEYDATL